MSKQDKTAKKKKKFLMKKFNSTVAMGSAGAGLASLLLAPTIMVDGGVMFLMGTGMMVGMYGGMGALVDKKNNKMKSKKTANGQKIYGPAWAVEMQAQLQQMLIFTNTSININIENPKKLAKFEKQRAMVLETALDLADHIKDVDDNNEPTGKPILYLERPLTGNDKDDYDARINPAHKPGGNTPPKPLGL